MNRKNQTILLKSEETKPTWLILDAAGKTLGRFASEVAKILRGKHKPTFTRHVDCGDGVIILNAEKIQVTGAKAANKIYRYYTGAIGGLREIPFNVMMARKPEYILRQAIEKMLPRTRLSNKQKKRLRIFKGEEHNLSAQQPVKVNI